MVSKFLRLLKLLVLIIACYTVVLLLVHLGRHRGAVRRSARAPFIKKAYSKPATAPLQEKSDNVVDDDDHGWQSLRRLLQSNRGQGSPLSSDKCAPFPRYADLLFEGENFQRMREGNLSYYLFGAYYDRRLEPMVAVLAMINTIYGPYPPTYCQMWFDGSSRPSISQVRDHKVIWYDSWGQGPNYIYPTLLSCPVPKGQMMQRVPQLVSLVHGTDGCARATNALHVIYEAPRRSHALRFAVCVKDLYYPHRDISARIVEWLELMQLLGAERVTAYVDDGALLPNTTRTLLRYVQHGFLKLRRFRMLQLPGVDATSYLNKRVHEVLTYNDCFYRNLYEYDFIGGFDLDEVIMPLGTIRNWTSLVHHLESTDDFGGNSNCQAWASYCFRNVYFPEYREKPPYNETLPKHFYMLQHVRRVAKHLHPSLAAKCLHATAFATTLHNHFPLSWQNSCAPLDVSTALAQMQHYREPENKADLLTPVLDDNIWRFEEQLVKSSCVVFRELGWSP
ncbi:uncharacterized protein LOC115629269 [Scaptodrosophila lebanonensis]|uniref:Glycosyltransferase family 92 protein n=1 Tax=Drosophila lebanonensis TaxID=7225 RepID=A0A6J2U250_DROLE|nr:uncharacterized protein LOC115629269 [Scaptodrosophila lebanonensis]